MDTIDSFLKDLSFQPVIIRLLTGQGTKNYFSHCVVGSAPTESLEGCIFAGEARVFAQSLQDFAEFYQPKLEGIGLNYYRHPGMGWRLTPKDGSISYRLEPSGEGIELVKVLRLHRDLNGKMITGRRV